MVSPMTDPTLEILKCFWKKVNKTSACWLWIGEKNNPSYGSKYGRFRNKMAHRFSYQIHKGEISKGLEIDHLCRVTLCVNPDHLEAVTHKINMDRSMCPSGINVRKKVSKCGLPYDYVRPTGGRGCRNCDRIKDHKYYAENKEEILRKDREEYHNARR